MICGRIVRVDEYADRSDLRRNLVQEFNLLCPECAGVERDAGDIARRPAQARHKAELHRVVTRHKNDRDRFGRRLGSNQRCVISGDEYSDRAANEFSCQCREAFVPTL